MVPVTTGFRQNTSSQIFERSQLPKLIAQLTSHKKTSSESLVDYISRADDIQYNLALVNEGISKKKCLSQQV